MSKLKIIGHRGARGLAPENTLASFKKALDCGVDAIEFDLRVTKDSIVTIHHDCDIKDMSGSKISIKKNLYKDLKKHKPDLVTFEEALETLGPETTLYIEIKPHEPTAPIVKIIKHYLKKGWASENFQVASFDQKVLREVHKALPEVEMIINEYWSGVRAHWRARQVGAKKISMDHHWLWSGFIASVHRGGLELYTYTLNDPAKAERWAKHGLAGVVTDFPDRFKS